MSELIFVYPDWFWGALVLLPLFFLRLWSHLRASKQLPGLVSPRLSHRLINGASQVPRWLVFMFRSAALLALLVALARPQLGTEEIEQEIDARNLLIAIDTSRSMMADDLPPNRLTRAKLAAKDIVLSLPEDRIGLIAFAGVAFLQAPFTTDHEAVIESIEQLDTETIPRGGTNLSAAVALALETMAEAKLAESILVIFSDGEALEGIEEVENARAKAKAQGLAILSVGVGTLEGSIIPEVDEHDKIIPGVFVRDQDGQVVRTRLITEYLQSLSADGGAYLHLGGASSLTSVVDQIRRGIASSRAESETRFRPIERFMWPLGGALILFTLSFLLPLFWPKSRKQRRYLEASRPVAASLALSWFLLPLNLGAADPLLSGQEAFNNRNYAEAISAYESALNEPLSTRDKSRLQLAIGSAAYQLGDYERAIEAFGKALLQGGPKEHSEALNNLGGTLFKKGEATLKSATGGMPLPDQSQSPLPPPEIVNKVLEDWETAIGHLETSLALSPNDEKIRKNLQYVKKRFDELEAQEPEPPQPEQDQQKQEDQKDQDQKDQDQKDQNEKGDDNKEDSSQDSQPQDSGGQDQPSNQDSQRQDQSSDPQEKNPGDDSQAKDRDGDNPQDSENTPDSPQDGENSGSENMNNSPPPPPQGQSPEQMPDVPSEGQLEANPNQNQPENAPSPNRESMADMQMNPDTGYSPSEARALLDSLSDETQVKAQAPVTPGEKYKNW